jgi:uncharacterized protein (TIGR02231 family)
MKKSILFLFAAVMLASPLFGDNEKEIKAPIGHVTVYPDRAQLTHEGAIDLLPGKTILKLNGLSPYIDANSIQVKGIGEYTILSVNLQNNYIQNLEDQPETKNIKAQIDALELKIEDERTAINLLDEKLSFLNTNKSVLLKETTFSVEQFKSLMDIYSSNTELIINTKLKKNRLVKDYEKQLAVLQQQLSDKIHPQELPSSEISVTVTAEKPVSGKITLSYVVGNAGWVPTYDIRVDDISKPVSIFYKANVYQTTGNDWKNVKISFSNASPWIAGNVPVLNPWFIDFYAPVVVRGYATQQRDKSFAPAAMEEVAKSDLKSGEMKKEVAAEYAVVEKTAGETSVTFDVAVPYTVLSDGKTQTIEIQRTSTPASYKYVTVPKASQLAYLTANIPDWAKQSLMTGEATLYFENTFVGKSQLNVNQLSDTLTVSLGTDPGILVKREKRKDFTSKKVIGANKTDTFSYLITVRNNKTNPIQVTVNDQVPVSSNSSITVEVSELSGGKHTGDTGILSWDLNLKPGEKKELVLTYSVKYPKNQTIILD